MHALGEASGLPDASQVRWCCVSPGPLVRRHSSALPMVDSRDWLRAAHRSTWATAPSPTRSLTRLCVVAQDVVTLQFVIHECPPAAIGALVAEARRLLRPGGVLLLSDNDPRCGRVC